MSFQSVKEPTNRQNARIGIEKVLYMPVIAKPVGTLAVAIRSPIKSDCCAMHFDLLHNSNLTVPMYADRFELFVLMGSLTSASLSNNLYLTD